VLANVATHEFAVLCAGISQDILDEIVSKLVPSNCARISRVSRSIDSALTVDQRHARAIRTGLADTL